MKKVASVFLLTILAAGVLAQDGYELWLGYKKLSAKEASFYNFISSVHLIGNSPTLTIAKLELQKGIQQLLGKHLTITSDRQKASIIIGKIEAPALKKLFSNQADSLGSEGFSIRSISKKPVQVAITANTDIGLLYGVFHLLRVMQSGQNLQSISYTSAPKIKYRLLNHWDNLNRTVERGYAGFSIWDWHRLPDYIDPRYEDYARANASIGINGTVLTNVNANAFILTPEYLEKVAALANVFRPYGIKVYLTARFSAPIEIGRLKTADPLDPQVINWWKEKADEIYKLIPDFGGFLVKANSEGQPGPQNYSRNHDDGANLLADAVRPHGGIVMWRAFVYSSTPEDRFKQAYNEFKPLDGKFRENVLVQVKNGPIDFQPREPFHPLFGAMPQTPLMMEFQLTQEYLGFATHLVYLSPMFKECLQADTYSRGAGSTVAEIIDGSLENHAISGMAGVANIGNDRNWTGHLFGQSNWYALGRLAWDHSLSSEKIAEEWISQTFTRDPVVISGVRKMMIMSHEALVNYMTPLGLHHIMGYGHHYGPAPWFDKASRADWNPVYFHRADSIGVGFDRTASGSNALSQYAPEVRAMYEDLKSCPENFLLWFHHVPWDFRMNSGRTLWEELCFKYYSGVDSIRQMQKIWGNLKGRVDSEKHNHVSMLLNIQEKEAVWWRNACVLYFQTFSRKPIPSQYEKPDKTLQYYMALRFPYAPAYTN